MKRTPFKRTSWWNSRTAIAKKGKRARKNATPDKRAADLCKEDGVCEMATLDIPCEGPLEDCHIITRRCQRLRHDPRNHLPGCMAHHRYAHDHPKRFKEWLEEVRPGLYGLLQRISNFVDEDAA